MTLSLRDAEDADQVFAFRVKHAAIGEYVDHVWGWDDTFQRSFHAHDWAANRPSIISQNGTDIGTIEVIAHADHLYLGEFYLLPEWQRHGLGSQLLGDVITRAQSERLPIRLQFLKINPVRSLYERHGFRIVGETKTHYLAERPIEAAACQPPRDPR